MGSTQDWIDSTRFMEEHKIVPVVSHVLDGLDSAEQGFDLLKSGEQFGKIIIRIGDTSAKETANL
jgi:NADPH-dependent curcumin reductase CurA